MRVALYVRVSTKEQVDGYSIDEQIDKLNAYAKAKDYTVLDTFVDGGHSGASLERPAIKELIKNIKSYDAVIVHKLNRLSSSQTNNLHLIEDVLDKTKEKLNAYDKTKYYTVFDTFGDGGHSGASLERPAIKELIKNIKSYDAVIVHKLNRLSRSQKDTLHLIEDVFVKNNVEFISL